MSRLSSRLARAHRCTRSCTWLGATLVVSALLVSVVCGTGAAQDLPVGATDAPRAPLERGEGRGNARQELPEDPAADMYWSKDSLRPHEPPPESILSGEATEGIDTLSPIDGVKPLPPQAARPELGLALPDPYLDPSFPDVRLPLLDERHQRQAEENAAQQAATDAKDRGEEPPLPITDEELYMKEAAEEHWDGDFREENGASDEFLDEFYDDPADW